MAPASASTKTVTGSMPRIIEDSKRENCKFCLVVVGVLVLGAREMVDQFVIGDLAIKIGIVPVAERRSKEQREGFI